MPDYIINPKEYAQTIREMISHENELTNHRLGWMSTFNGFLFSAVGFLSKEPNHTEIIAAVCIAGFVVDLSILLSLSMSEIVRNKLYNLWKDKNISLEEIPPVWGANLVKYGKYRFLMPWFTIPLVLMIAWVRVLYLHLND